MYLIFLEINKDFSNISVISGLATCTYSALLLACKKGYPYQAFCFSPNKHPRRVLSSGRSEVDTGLGNTLGFDTHTSARWDHRYGRCICPSRSANLVLQGRLETARNEEQ